MFRSWEHCPALERVTQDVDRWIGNVNVIIGNEGAVADGGKRNGHRASAATAARRATQRLQSFHPVVQVHWDRMAARWKEAGQVTIPLHAKKNRLAGSTDFA